MEMRSVTGRITETESGRGVGGLMVRVYDKDLLFDDLLGTSTTGDDGTFQIGYTEADFSELFERRPDVYVAVYAPPCRFLTDTSDHPVHDAGPELHIELQIDRDTLGEMSPGRPDDVVEIEAGLDPELVRTEPAGAYSRLSVPGLSSGAAPGQPALPEARHYVVLPLDGEVISVEVDEGEPVELASAGRPLPVQELTPDVGVEAEYGDDVTIVTIDIDFTEPDPAVYDGDEPFPATLVEVLGSEEIGPLQIVAVRVSPMRFDPSSGRTLVYPRLRYEVRFDRGETKRRGRDDGESKQIAIAESRAETLQALLGAETVFAAKGIFAGPLLLLQEDAAHVIITDDYRWPASVPREDGTTRAPTIAERGTALSGSMTAEFERLAEWKTARGMRSRVITVSEIVDGGIADFTRGGFARDLAEVIRNFIKWACAELDTSYVLIGGDLDVVPMRYLTGSSTYGTIGCSKSVDNPPEPGNCRVLGSVVKLHPKFTATSADPLSSLAGGLRIPFDRQAGSGRLGWFYTNETDFQTKNVGFTRLPAGASSRYVIVEGPAAVLDDHYYWLRDVNSIPSDLYYSSLVGSGYDRPGFHDFDDNNNGLYGQFHGTTPLDAVDFWSDVWVGRASVESGAEAKGFVDKVITYERLETPEGEPVDSSYLQKVIYAADWWGRKVVNRQTDATIPPDEDTFTNTGGATTTKIRLGFDLTMSSGQPSRRLIAETPNAQIVVPYDTSPSSTSAGWYFVTNNSYGTQSATPTRFIKVLGPSSTVDPTRFFWDPIGLELAASEKETMRAINDTKFPDFTSVQRHYADYFDLSAPPPIVPLDATTLRAALDDGAHIVSLTGHGWYGGCCAINTSSQPDFTNAGEYFIAFADSCSTGRPDGVDSTAEISVNDPDGGAVGYVGNTRYSWIGVGDNYEQFFWSKVATFARLGPAAGMRLATGNVNVTWTRYAQNLFGDPEMPVWTCAPQFLEVDHPASVSWGATLGVTVRKLGVPQSGCKVTLLGGWTSSVNKPRVYSTKTTQTAGSVSFQLPSTGAALSEVRLTVTRRDHATFTVLIPITS